MTVSTLKKYICFFLLFVSYYACGNVENKKDSNSEKTNGSQNISLEEAEAKMFYKLSGYQPPLNVELNGDNNNDVIYDLTIKYLNDNSILKALINWMELKTQVPGSNITYIWNKTPIDTLFLDDFTLDGDNIGCSKKIIEIAINDRSWCSYFSKMLSQNERNKQIVQMCNNNIIGLDDLYNTCIESLKPYSVKNVPHIPFIYIYSFIENVTLYMDHLEREAMYMFTGYSFYDINRAKVLHVIEEFDF